MKLSVAVVAQIIVLFVLDYGAIVDGLDLGSMNNQTLLVEYEASVFGQFELWRRVRRLGLLVSRETSTLIQRRRRRGLRDVRSGQVIGGRLVHYSVQYNLVRVSSFISSMREK